MAAHVTNGVNGVNGPKSSAKPKSTHLAYNDLGKAYANLARERVWSVEGAIEKSPLVVIAGPEKQNKSWIIADLVRAIVTGGKWLGTFASQMEPDHTVYVIENEYGPEEYARRLARLARGAGEAPKRLFRRLRHYSDGDLFLNEECKALHKLRADIAECPPALVVIDPLRNFLGDAEENSNSDIVRALNLVSDIRDRSVCPVVIAHHLNKQGSMTGARALRTRADLFLEGTDEEDPWYSTIGRTLRSSDPIKKKFTVEIEHTDDDDTIATTQLSCRFEGASTAKKSLSKTAHRLLDALKSMKAHKGTTNAIATAAGVTSGKARSRGLAELQEAKLIVRDGDRWCLSTSEFFDTRKALSNDKKEGDQGANQAF